MSHPRMPGATHLGCTATGEQFESERLPAAVFYPTGGGTGLIGMWKPFDEMEFFQSAATAAGASREAGVVAPDDEVVLFNTGSGLEYVGMQRED